MIEFAIYKAIMSYRSVWISVVLLIGCTSNMEHVKCPGFDFDQLAVNNHYFDKTLYFSNGIDTIRLDCVDLTYSVPLEFDRGNGIVKQCLPNCIVTYRDSSQRNYIDLIFESPNEFSKNLNLYVHFNSRSAKICLDSINKFSATRISIPEVHEKNGDAQSALTDVVSFEIEKYRVICFENKYGDQWNLIKVEYVSREL